MRIIERAAALVTVLAMPAVAYGLARAAFSLWEGLAALSSADAGFALDSGLAFAAACAGAVIATYLALTGYAMLIGTLVTSRTGRGSRRRRSIPRALAALAPAGWTRITAAALGVTLSAGIAGPALAADAGAAPSAGPGWVDAPLAYAAADAGAAPSAGPGWVDAPLAYPAPDMPAASQSIQVPAPPEEASATVEAALPGDIQVTASPAVGWTAQTVSAVNPTNTDPTNADPANTDPAHAEPTHAEPIHAEPIHAEPTHAEPTHAEPIHAADTEGNAYVVQSGDSLWRITESLLGSDAATADIAAAWPVLYEANRDVIGADPSLIHVGIALTVPAGFAS